MEVKHHDPCGAAPGSTTDRLRDVIRRNGSTTLHFARRIGLRGQAIYDVLCGNTPLTPELAGQIAAHCPDVDARWLLEGAPEE